MHFTPPGQHPSDTGIAANKPCLKGSEEYFRNKIVMFSFLMGIIIVYQHVRFGNEESQWLNELHVFKTFLGKTCVPMFFAISGYLFFRGFKWDKLNNKFIRRVHTLLIPYLIWNVFYVLFMLIMSKAGVMSDISIESSPSGVTKAILNAECSPLWFLRYLMIFVLASPLAFFILRNKLTGALLLICMMLYNYYNYCAGTLVSPLQVNSNTLALFNYQFMFFALGAYGALNWNRYVESYSKNKTRIAIIAMMMLCILYWVVLRTQGTLVTSHAFRFIWIPIVWFAFDALPMINVRDWMRFSFFIYCSHMFVLYCLQGATRFLYPYLGSAKPILVFIEYLVVGVLTVYLLIKTASFLKRKSPTVFKLLTGSRG